MLINSTRVNKFTSLLIVTLISVLFISLPQNDEISINDHEVTTSNGSLLNRNKLVVSMLPHINGIDSLNKGEKQVLQIPFFVNNRYIIKVNYIPWIGENRTVLKLQATDNYSFLMKDITSSITYKIHLKTYLVTLLLFLLMQWLNFRYRKPKIKIVDALLTLLIITLLTQGSVIDTLLILGILLVYNFKIKLKIKFIMISTLLIVTVLLGTLTTTEEPKNGYTGISKNELVLKAAAEIHDAKDVRKSIDFIERAYTKKGVLAVVDCHLALHELGIITYLKFQDINKTLTYGKTSCEFGYLHGVEDSISLLTNNVEESKIIYQEACKVASSGRAKSIYDECVHGSGHAFFDLYQGDQALAYHACKIWLENEVSCESAVTMSLGEQTKFNGNRVYFPNLCLTVADVIARGACLKISFRYIFRELKNVDQELSKAHQFCAKIALELKEDCLYSIGMATAYANLENIANVNSTLVGKYCTYQGSLDTVCGNSFISYLSFYSTLYAKPIVISEYCSVMGSSEKECTRLATMMSDRLKGSL